LLSREHAFFTPRLAVFLSLVEYPSGIVYSAIVTNDQILHLARSEQFFVQQLEALHHMNNIVAADARKWSIEWRNARHIRGTVWNVGAGESNADSILHSGK
jgi:hypothetical protein